MQAYPIFHIEDDEDYRTLVRIALHTHGHQGTVEYADAVSALEALRKGDATPALILLDLNMPRLSGREFITAIKSDERLSQIPIVVFTTSSNPDDEDFCEQYDVDMLTKPSSMTAIEDLMGWVLRQKIQY